MSRPETRWSAPAWRRILVPFVLLAALVVTAGAVSLWRNVGEFQPLGFTAEARGGHWLVTAVEAEDSGLAAGDQIVLVDGESYGRVGELRSALRRRPVSELVVLRDGELRTVEHTLPPLDIDFPYLILALIGAGYLLIGLYTLMRDRRRPALIFYLWCLTSALVYLVSARPPFDLAGRSLYLFEEVGRVLLAPLTLHLFSIFPVPLGERRRLTRAVPFFYLPAAFLLALQADLVFLGGRLLFGGATAAALTVLDRLELLHLGAFSLAAVAVIGWRLRTTRALENRRQVTWIALGMVAGYVPFLLLYVLPHTLGLQWPRLLTSAAVLPLALVPLTFAYSILRYKLWDIGVIVRESMSISLTVLTGVVGFSLANLAINRLLPADMAAMHNLLAFASGLGIAGLLVPTRRRIDSALERVHYGDRFTKRRALLDYGREVVRERDLGRLCRNLLQRLETGLELRRANLLLDHAATLVPIRLEPAAPQGMASKEIANELWESDVFSLSGVELPGGRTSSVQRLYNAGYRYAFPLIVRDQRVGLMVCTYREGDVPLSSDDLDLIRGLLNQTSLAIENADLLDQIQRQLDEVVRLQRFSQGIFESTPAGIAVIDAEGRIASLNQAFAHLAGVGVEEGTGAPLAQVLDLGALPEPDEGMRQIRVTDRAGRERHLQVSVAPMQEGDQGRVVVAQDISERVAMENALKEKERLASLGMLAAGVAHEVNTPITGISSYAQMLLAETDESDPRYELLKKVEKQTFRAASIVHNLLELARDKQGQHFSVALAPLLQECLDLQKERMEHFGITLRWQAPDPGLMVTGSEGELQQVFNNLVVNAVDAMAGSGGTLGIDVEIGDERVWITVEDDGIGMPPEDVEKVFKPFFTTKLGQGGTGLGLAISYNIVRRHDGDLRVTSEPGKGSRFIVELPRHRPRAAASTDS